MTFGEGQQVCGADRSDHDDDDENTNTKQTKIASPPDLTRRRTQEATYAGSAGGRQAEQGRWSDTLLEHAINKGLPGMCTFESDSANWSIRVSSCLT